MKTMWIGVGLACLFTLAGCGGGTSEAPKQAAESAPAAGSAGAAAVPDEAGGGTVTGKVVFEGTKPTMRSLDMSAVPACTRAHAGSPAKSEEVIVNNNGTLKYAFVYVKAGLPDRNWQIPATAVTLDQHGCMYQPHVLGIMTGQNIEIKNSDPTNHNIHPTPKVNQEWNESQAPGSESKMKTFAREEIMIPVKCNVHPWMRSYIGVVSHPFFAVTGDDGTFTLKGLPPGTYTVEVWHEKYPAQQMQVTVGAKESKTADFTFKG
jgi:hypothetical protein